jgi:hypothetical protein
MSEPITPRDVRSAASDLAVVAAEDWMKLARATANPDTRTAMLDAALHLVRLTRAIMKIPITNDTEAPCA